MRAKAGIGFFDELAVKPLFAPARLVSTNQDNGLPVCVEGEGYSPNTIRGIEPQFLHIFRMGKQLVLHIFWQSVEFGLELLMKEDFPRPDRIMYCKTYAVKYI